MQSAPGRPARCALPRSGSAAQTLGSDPATSTVRRRRSRPVPTVQTASSGPGTLLPARARSQCACFPGCADRCRLYPRTPGAARPCHDAVGHPARRRSLACPASNFHQHVRHGGRRSALVNSGNHPHTPCTVTTHSDGASVDLNEGLGTLHEPFSSRVAVGFGELQDEADTAGLKRLRDRQSRQTPHLRIRPVPESSLWLRDQPER